MQSAVQKQCALNLGQCMQKTFYLTNLFGSKWTKASCCNEQKLLLICSTETQSTARLILFAIFSELALFALQACTLAPATPITVPRWSCSPLRLTPPLPPPLTCRPDNTGWTETSVALTTCPHWLSWTAREMGESSPYALTWMY